MLTSVGYITLCLTTHFNYGAVMIRLLLSSIAVISFCGSAHAWSEAGHRIISSIAFRQLTPAEQEKIVAVLKQHPRFEQDFKAKMPDGLDEKEQNEFIFQQAGIWPDLARGFKGDDSKKYHHATWHYINVPHYLTQADETAMKGKLKANVSLEPPSAEQEDMNVIQTIRLARKLIADKSTPDDKKAIMLCWLFHLVGDIHQPLHSTAMFSKTLFPSGDRGGNSIKTEQRDNLHAVWDQFLGNKAQYRTARNRAIAIVNDADTAKIGKASAAKVDDADWLHESHDLAGTAVYDYEVRGHLRANANEKNLPELKLTERYLKAGGKVAEVRVIEAGYRLGEELKKLAN